MTARWILAVLLLVASVVAAPQAFAQTGAAEQDAAARANEALRDLSADAGLPVFGSQLFGGQPASNRTVGDPNYVLARGDRVAVRAFGAFNADFVEQIDQNGVLFIPQVGPVNLAGKTAGQLQATVQDAIRQTFTENVRVYASLVTPGSIGVYVSGDVNAPGRYLGSSTDDILYYLQSARGIDVSRGSFRDIRILRGGELIERVDLYSFLFQGVLPDIDFMEGDVIFVTGRGPLIEASGAVLAPYAYELPSIGFEGARLKSFARPLPEATHVALTGTRDGAPFTRYVTIEEFTDIPLTDGDRADFRADLFGQSIAVAVQSTGADVQALYILPRDARLTDLLGQLDINESRIDIGAIHVNRPSVAAQQKQALDQSLDRLERSAALGGAFSAEAAQVRRAEAEVITNFVARAREAEPTGTITVVEDDSIQDLTLEDGDVLVLPDKTDVVLVAGEVVAPGAFVADSDDTLRSYIKRAGGFQDQANKRRFVVLKRSGAAVQVGGRYRPEAGDQILVLPRASNRGFLLASEITEIVFQLALSTATVARL
jgi:protein involved in polysaccharide export with SLBB domain